MTTERIRCISLVEMYVPSKQRVKWRREEKIRLLEVAYMEAKRSEAEVTEEIKRQKGLVNDTQREIEQNQRELYTATYIYTTQLLSMYVDTK